MKKTNGAIRTFDDEIQRYLRRYEASGKPLEVNFRKIIPELNNADRATHLIHTYPAKLLMHIPYFFLNNDIFSQAGDTVLDPFCGSGTVLLESLLMGRNSAGADSNPLARLISKVKTTNYNIDEIVTYSDQLRESIKKKSRKSPPNVANIDYWFLPEIKTQLVSIYEQVKDIQNKRYRDFFLLCFSNCLKKVSLADPRVSVPVRLKIDQYGLDHPLRQKTKHIISSLKTLSVKDKFFEIVDNNIRRSKSFDNLRVYRVKNMTISEDARKLEFGRTKNNNSDFKVDLIITSPPYAGAQKYIRSSSLNLGWLELMGGRTLREIDGQNIGREEYRKNEYLTINETGLKPADRLIKEIYKVNPLRAFIASNYLIEMRAAFRESVNVLKSRGYFVLVAANNQVCGKEFKTQEYLRMLLEEEGLKLRLRMIDDIKSYGLMTKRNKTANVITREWVMVFQK